jgi:hypothetical protein
VIEEGGQLGDRRCAQEDVVCVGDEHESVFVDVETHAPGLGDLHHWGQVVAEQQGEQWGRVGSTLGYARLWVEHLLLACDWVNHCVGCVEQGQQGEARQLVGDLLPLEASCQGSSVC